MPGPRPLPPRDGIDAVRFRLPDPPHRRAIAAELLAAFPEHAEEIRAQLAAGTVVDRYGRPVGDHARPVKNVDVWLYLSPPPEPVVPGRVDVLHRDDALVVVDKPHFLATTPRAAHIRETALVRTRVATGLPDLVPAHRLDRGTAGLLAFSVRPELRGALAMQFQQRTVVKKYLAVTHLPAAGSGDGARIPEVGHGVQWASRIEKLRGILQGREIPGEPNAHTRARLVERCETAEGPRGLWLLEPTTGQTHQLRIHLSAAGAPIVDDDLYPHKRTWDAEDFSAPLQLLAAGLELRHPADGRRMRFASRRRLAGWPGHWPTAETIWPETTDSGEESG